MPNAVQILICRPPARVDNAWPEPLATAAAWFNREGSGAAHFVDSAILGESENCFQRRVAEIVVDVVALACGAAELALDVRRLERCGRVRPVIALWPGEPDGAEALLAIGGVRAVVCGEPERGLVAAALIEACTVYPSDPVADLDDLPRPHRDYTVHRYRLPLPGLPDAPMLVVRAGRDRLRWHGDAWLAEDIEATLAAFPRLASVAIGDAALNADAARFAAYARRLRDSGRPWAARVRLLTPHDADVLHDGHGAAGLEVTVAEPHEAFAAAALDRLRAAGVALQLAVPTREEPPPSVRQAMLTAFPTPATAGRKVGRILVVGQHVEVYMPPWLVRAGLELGYEALAVDPWVDPRAVRLLTDSRPEDIVLIDRGLGMTPELLAATPGRTVLYYPDPLPVDEDAPPFAFQKYAEFRAIAAHCDDVVLHDLHGRAFLEGRGHANLRGAVMLPFDPTRFRDLGLTRDIDLLFVGLESEHRRRWMERLRADDVEVTWPKVWGEEFVAALNHAKIVLNLHTLPTPNTELRLCEAMACGCFVVSEALTPPPRFIDGEHLVIVDMDNAADTIRACLADEPRRTRIARQGQAYVAEHHTARHVLAELLALIGVAP
jgi:hypothetical protein